MVFFYDSLDRLDRLIQGVVPVKDKMVSKQNCVGRASERNVDLTESQPTEQGALEPRLSIRGVPP